MLPSTRLRTARAPIPAARRVLRTAAVTLVAGLALLLGATPALAHTRLQSSDPTDGSSLDAAPKQVTLTFNEEMTPGFSTITVVGPDGAQYQTGDVAVQGGTVSQAVNQLGAAGQYKIGYRVVSADGHPVTGEVAFTLTAAGAAAATTAAPVPPAAPNAAPAATAAPAPAAAAPAESDGGTPVWPWILGAVVLVGGGVVAALRLGRG